jgi:cyclopropane fatty-acyl-phospholipid synthase-like methyltransferase
VRRRIIVAPQSNSFLLLRLLPQICENVRLKKGDRFLDIGCGWGTLVGYAYRNFQACATGVTLSKEGAKWSSDNNKPKEPTPGKGR